MNNLIGSTSQIKWAASIIGNIKKRYPDAIIPDIKEAAWFIANRDLSYENLIEKANKLKANPNFASTPFTSSYPKFNRQNSLLALKSLSWDRVAVIDTETNGMSKGSEVIELSIVRYHDRQILFNSLIQPYDYEHYGQTKQTKKAFEVNGITIEELRTAPALFEVWKDIIAILKSLQVIVYNVSFDFPMLQRSAMAHNLYMPKLYATCAMYAYQNYRESPDYFSLGEACEYFNIDRSVWGKHRSLADVYATIELIKCMLASSEEDQEVKLALERSEGIEKIQPESLSLSETTDGNSITARPTTKFINQFLSAQQVKSMT